MPKNISYGETVYSVFFVILPDNNTLYDIFLLNRQAYGENASWLKHYFGFDIGGSNADKQALCDSLTDILAKAHGIWRISSPLPKAEPKTLM